jgi:hypothetical protein
MTGTCLDLCPWRSAATSAGRAPDAPQRGVKRSGAALIRGRQKEMDPGSALRHFAPQRARGTLKDVT